MVGLLDLRVDEAERARLADGDLVTVRLAALLGLELAGRDRVAGEEGPDDQLLLVLTVGADQEGRVTHDGTERRRVHELEVAGTLAVVERELERTVEGGDLDQADVPGDRGLVALGRCRDLGVVVVLPLRALELVEIDRLEEPGTRATGPGLALREARREVVGVGVDEGTEDVQVGHDAGNLCGLCRNFETCQVSGEWHAIYHCLV